MIRMTTIVKFSLILGLGNSLMTGRLLATGLVVNTLADTNDGVCDAFNCSLREAIDAANAASGDDTITFSVGGVILLGSQLPETSDPAGLTIDATGQNVTISGDHKVLIFKVPVNGKLTLRSMAVIDGNFLGGGGAIRVLRDGIVRLENVTFAGNQSSYAGAIYSYGTVTIVNSAFLRNNASLGGGAIVNVTGGHMSVSSSLFSGNTSPYFGGALENSAEIVIENSTFFGNAGLDVAANLNAYDASLTIINSTFSGNTSSSGTIHNYVGTVTLKNTIVANPAGGANCTGSITDGGGNLSYPDNTCPGINLDPKLGSLADNGGPTQTMALLSESAAIDAAQDCKDTDGKVLANDQRGILRPQGPQCDIGAYEKSQIAFAGFYPPVSNSPGANMATAGQAVPLIFGAGGSFGLDIIAAGYPTSQPVACDTGVPSGPPEPTVTPGNSVLTYDSFTNLYTVGWKTDKAWAGTCRKIVLRLTDGMDHAALFRFR
jgi:CSLREA domain-containing protein